jgi:iron complex transport system ATP-binding protein
MIRLNKVDAGYGEVPALREIDVHVGERDFIGILGPNGSGKSTLLRIISGIMKPSSGEVEIRGKKISELTRREISKLLAVVQQEALFAFDFTVMEVVLMGRNPYLRRLQMEGEEDLRAAREALEMTDTLHLSERSINELSAGERQRVVIARALAQKTEILLLDEPTAHLDIMHQIEIFELLKSLHQDGMTIVLVSHDLNLAGEYCADLILLNQGKVVAKGPPSSILQRNLIEEVYEIMPLTLTNPETGRPLVIPLRIAKP